MNRVTRARVVVNVDGQRKVYYRDGDTITNSDEECSDFTENLEDETQSSNESSNQSIEVETPAKNEEREIVEGALNSAFNESIGKDENATLIEENGQQPANGLMIEGALNSAVNGSTGKEEKSTVNEETGQQFAITSNVVNDSVANISIGVENLSIDETEMSSDSIVYMGTFFDDSIMYVGTIKGESVQPKTEANDDVNYSADVSSENSTDFETPPSYTEQLRILYGTTSHAEDQGMDQNVEATKAVESSALGPKDESKEEKPFDTNSAPKIEASETKIEFNEGRDRSDVIGAQLKVELKDVVKKLEF
ncbi:uncharacterized protein LOC116346496 [Contarinia nasturtii]|uniref:uncharacterized protein LOC116346496 n=1 Tax=Contarinia nasturtii TaxID=265458 RepID=UPI0012D39679|nr:uncharacterized protein LOC116346496 [Contarinia nasturtii]